MSHSGAWQVSAKALIRTFATRAKEVDKIVTGCTSRRESDLVNYIINKRSEGAFRSCRSHMNERFLAVCRKQQSSAHASSLARVSSNLPLSRTTHAPTTFSLPPGASLYPTHSPPCLSPLQATGALERERRLCSIGRAARYKGERQHL